MQLTKKHVDALLTVIDMVPESGLKTDLREVAVMTHGAVLVGEQVQFAETLFAGADATADTGEFDPEDLLELTPDSVLPNTQNITSTAIEALQRLIDIGVEKNEYLTIGVHEDAVADALMVWEEIQDILEEHIYKGRNAV